MKPTCVTVWKGLKMYSRTCMGTLHRLQLPLGSTREVLHKMTKYERRLTQFGQSTKEKVVPITKNRNSFRQPMRTELRCAPPDEEVLQLLKNSVLDDWVDDQDQSWSNSSPETSNTILGEYVMDSPHYSEFPALSHWSRDVGLRTANCLRCLDNPYGIADDSCRRPCGPTRLASTVRLA